MVVIKINHELENKYCKIFICTEMENLLTRISPEVIAHTCTYMTINQLKEYMKLSPELYDLCLPFLQSKEQEYSLLELNNQRLRYQGIIADYLKITDPNMVLDVSNVDIPNQPLLRMTISRAQKYGLLIFEGTNIVTSPDKAQEIYNILTAQPIQQTQPL